MHFQTFSPFSLNIKEFDLNGGIRPLPHLFLFHVIWFRYDWYRDRVKRNMAWISNSVHQYHVLICNYNAMV